MRDLVKTTTPDIVFSHNLARITIMICFVGKTVHISFVIFIMLAHTHSQSDTHIHVYEHMANFIFNSMIFIMNSDLPNVIVAHALTHTRTHTRTRTQIIIHTHTNHLIAFCAKTDATKNCIRQRIHQFTNLLVKFQAFFFEIPSS